MKYPLSLPALVCGDAREWLSRLPDKVFHCCVTSPPYWGLRDYGLGHTVWGGNPRCDHVWGDELEHGRRGKRGVSGTGGDRHPSLDKAGQGPGSGGGGCFCRFCNAWKGSLGLEPCPELYVENLVAIMRQVYRVLRDDGTLWLNLGDSYSGKPLKGIKSKELVGIPWRAAFALRQDGWYLRSDIIWHKTNPMPESVKDRCTKAHEYIFLLTKSKKYYYDASAIKEPEVCGRMRGPARQDDERSTNGNSGLGRRQGTGFRNRRDVWAIATRPYKGAHFATFPPDLVTPCVIAGTSEKGCCSECGAPWMRILRKRNPVVNDDAQTGNEAVRHDGGVRERAPKGSEGGNVLATRTESTDEWEPSCKCDAPVTACRVLDPFGGSGTTGQVARRNNRDFFVDRA